MMKQENVLKHGGIGAATPGGKNRPFARKLLRAGRALVLAATLAGLSPNISAQASADTLFASEKDRIEASAPDTAKSTTYSAEATMEKWREISMETGKEAKKEEPVKKNKIGLSLAPKASAWVYGKGETPGAGLGIDLKQKISKRVSLSGEATLGYAKPPGMTEGRIRFTQSKFSVNFVLGKSNDSKKNPVLSAYGYTDDFMKVDIRDPAFGILFKKGPFCAAIERGETFSKEIVGVAFPGGVTLNGILMQGNRGSGYFVPIGDFNRAGILLGVPAKVFDKPLLVQFLGIRDFDKGKNVVVNIRVVIKLPYEL